jgi:hypothetical protein
MRNPETKPRPDELDRLVFTLLEAEGLCDSARLRLGRPDQLDYSLPEAEELCKIVRFQLCEAAWVIPDFELSNSARPKPGWLDRSEYLPEAEEPYDTAGC